MLKLKQFTSKLMDNMMYGTPLKLDINDDVVSIIKDISIPYGEESMETCWKIYHNDKFIGKYFSVTKAMSVANKELFDIYDEAKHFEEYFNMDAEEIMSRYFEYAC